MNKEIKKLLVVLILFSLATGIFGNFEEFWMEGSGLSLKTISIILSLASLLSCSVIFLCVNWIKPIILKKFACTIVFAASFVSFFLYLLHGTKFLISLKFYVMVHYVLCVEILAVIYPLMTFIKKSNKLYAIKDLLYTTMYYTGVVIGLIFLNKSFFNIKINYNSYLLISSVLMAIAGTVLSKVIIVIKDTKDDNLLSTVVSKVKNDSISRNYLAFSFLGSTAYYIVVGVLMLMLVHNLNLTESNANIIRLILGISSPILGAVILAKLTLKNNYINIGIKYIVRSIIYLLPIFYLNKITLLIAILYTEITSSWYSHVTDAPYINRFSPKEQLAFSNLKDIIGYLAKALGTFICGICIIKNIKFNFLISSIIFLIAVFFAYKALYQYNNEKSGGIDDRK